VIDRHPEDTQTLYAELLALLLALEGQRSGLHLAGPVTGFRSRCVTSCSWAAFMPAQI
jgi:hypothetical protein